MVQFAKKMEYVAAVSHSLLHKKRKTVRFLLRKSIFSSVKSRQKLNKTLWYVMLRFDTVRYGSVRFGTVRYGSVRYGSVRYGSVRFGHGTKFGSPSVLLQRIKCCASSNIYFFWVLVLLLRRKNGWLLPMLIKAAI